MEKVILSSDNKDKIKEIKEILKDLDVKLLSKKDLGLDNLEVVENGKTLESNALKKARSIYDVIKGHIVIADDTGLFVDALNGDPGIFSGRYSGENATYEDNNEKLLKELNGLEDSKRSAYFMTVAAIIDKKGNEHIVKGICKGKIAKEYKSEGGFGYDPLFIPEGYEESFREMGRENKNKISHRKKALEEVRLKIEEILNENRSN
ncbi:MAG: RdgB/HAM1 family non-canonical purine NTP pyrophosphatase [Bacillota bacterium]|nr:RdgB/HAM1 family non-canonical purine NTP pyrophosphatase [Bacillota bacterium]